MDKADRKLLKLLSAQLFSGYKTPDLAEDDQKVLDEAFVQTVALVAFSNITLTQFSQNTSTRLKLELNALMQRNVAVNHGHLGLDSLLCGAGIPYTIIKGLASAHYYPDYFMRAMGDVDFLVLPEDFDKADRFLLNNGFVKCQGERDHHITYDKDGVRYELHTTLPGIPKSEIGARLQGYLSDTVATARRIKGEGYEISAPDTFHHGLIILLHNLHHLTGDGLGLRQLCDWAVFINSLTCEEFSACFDTVLKETGLLRFARVMSLVCEENLGCKNVFASFSDEEKALAKEMLLDIFAGGNFGQKNPDRSHEQILLSADNDKTMFSQGIKSLNKIVYSHWKLAKKCKILLPFGWVFFSLRYVFRSLLGKRPEIRPQSILNEAIKRKEFYKKLKLFEN